VSPMVRTEVYWSLACGGNLSMVHMKHLNLNAISKAKPNNFVSICFGPE
jgi:hypothetical protein